MIMDDENVLPAGGESDFVVEAPVVRCSWLQGGDEAGTALLVWGNTKFCA